MTSENTLLAELLVADLKLALSYLRTKMGGI